MRTEKSDGLGYAPPTSPKQRWACSSCGRVRQWGFGTPPRGEEEVPRFLLCSRCNGHEEHVYVRP